ncbi:hypothetical protein BT96DRAFT_418576 [Gymnopus androsaceus JB14]|uniref:Uncharacterized protein n=1 Tax=Gymnopus androsaceus JB14 TaxID=1447944 RepID=A0A6A4I149_9AGAR|nr:hypothetical protein BT96DRAFT_418576 [Gymnopus androsaceus JB14]
MMDSYVYEEPPVLWPVASGAISSLIINCSRTLSKLRLEGFCDHTSTGSPWPGITGRGQHPSPWRIDSLRLDTFPVDHFFPTMFDSSCNFAAISDLHIEIASHDGLRTQNIQKFLAFSKFDGLKTLSLGVVSVTDRDSESSWKNATLDMNHMPALRSLKLFLSMPRIWSGRLRHTYLITSFHCNRALDTIVTVLQSAYSSTLMSIELIINPQPYKFFWTDTKEEVPADLLRFDHLLNNGRFPNLAKVVLEQKLTPLFPICHAKGLLQVQPYVERDCCSFYPRSR